MPEFLRDRFELQERTQARNQSVWVVQSLGGIMAPLSRTANDLMVLHRAEIDSYLVVTDDQFSIKDYQLKKNIELAEEEQRTDQLIADEKYETERQKIALEIATNEYVNAARWFDAHVRALIMAAREYAAEVEREQIELEKRRAQLAVAKEELRLKQINAEIFFEYVNAAMVQADIAKMKLEVAKAHTKVILAEIEAEQANIRLIEAELQEAMVVAEKASLQADVAMAFAEVLVRQLAKVQLDVEKKQIEAGFKYIAQKLTDMLEIWDVRERIELLKKKNSEEIVIEILSLLAGEKAFEDLKKTEVAHDRNVLEYEDDTTDTYRELTRDQLDLEQASLFKLLEAKSDAEIDTMQFRSWAKLIANAAHRWTYKNNYAGKSELTGINMRVEKES